MGAINEYVGPEFPGANTTIEESLGAGDCSLFDTFEELCHKIQSSDGDALTIRFGRAYTPVLKTTIEAFCEV